MFSYRYCYYSSHEHCVDAPTKWIDRTKPMTGFKFNDYIATLHCQCIQESKAAEAFVIDYSKFSKIITTTNIITFLLEAHPNVLKQINDNQIRYFQNDIFQQIVETNEYLNKFTNGRLANNMLSTILNSLPITITINPLTTKTLLWWENVNIKRNELNAIIENNIMWIEMNTTVLNKSFLIMLSHFHEPIADVLIIAVKTIHIELNKLVAHLLSTESINRITQFMKKYNIVITDEIVKKESLWISEKTKSDTEITQIIGILSVHGLRMVKETVLIFLRKGRYIPNLHLYGIELDEEILITAFGNKIFMYEPPKKVSEETLIVLCKNIHNNDVSTLYLEKFRKIGCNFTQSCLNSACFSKNFVVIKYLMETCKLNITDSAFEQFFKENYNQIDCIVYNSYEPDSKTISLTDEIDEKTVISLNNDVLTTINKSEKSFDDKQMCNANSKLKTMLNIKTNYRGVSSMTFGAIFQLLMKYFIDKQCVIGQYFIINGEFSDIVGMEEGAICQIDELRKLAEYLVSEATP